MTEPARPDPSSHPLLADRPRLERIKNNMHVQIQRVLHPRGSGAGERVLAGGESVEDVLQEALLDLLRCDPAKLTGPWEALSVVIARNNAKDALTRATRQRRADDPEQGSHGEVNVVSAETVADVADPDPYIDPDVAFTIVEQHRVQLTLARQLPDQDRGIFFPIYYHGATMMSVAAGLGITPQAVGQRYRRIARDLHAAARQDPEYPTLHVSEGGNNP